MAFKSRLNVTPISFRFFAAEFVNGTMWLVDNNPVDASNRASRGGNSVKGVKHLS
jgi:hypothetical protein